MRLSPWRIAAVAGVLLPAASFLFAASAPAVTIVLCLLGTGATLALLSIPEISVLLSLGASLVYGTGLLLLHTLLRGVIPALGALPFLFSLVGLSVVLGAVSTFILWRLKLVRRLSPVTRGDAIFLMIFALVLVSTLLVSRANGYVPAPNGGEEFHARGFVNGDTMTLFALTNTQLQRHNPFAADQPLEYPTLVHQALADVMEATGGDITRAAWWLIVPVLFGTVAVSVLSALVIFRGQRVPVWGVLLLLVAYGSTWESFTYPQSHTFLTGLFVLFVLLLVRRDQCERAAERRLLRFAIGGLAILLLFSNAVLGTAAVAVAVGSNILQLFNRSWTTRDRISGLIGSAMLLALFFLFPPGAGALGTLNVAYTAVPQFMVAAYPAGAVLWALWDTAWIHRSATLLGASVLLPALAFVTLFFSGRDIVAENSPRFLFLLILVGWPAVIPLVQRLGDWWWRQVRHVEHSLQELVVLWGGGAFTVLVLVVPAAAAVAGTLDMLARKPPLAVSHDELKAFAWIRAETPPDAVFLRTPESLFENRAVSPLSLPAFTGRAQLRSEYWLSPADGTYEDLRRFFVGEGPVPVSTKVPGRPEATRRVPVGVSYLYCGPEITECPSVGTVVYVSGMVIIRAL